MLRINDFFLVFILKVNQQTDNPIPIHTGETLMGKYEDHWLTPKRIRNYSYIFLCIFVCALFLRFYTANGNFDFTDQPLGSDFTSFYAAAKLATQGDAASVYHFESHFAAEKEAVGDQLQNYYSFSYPPTYLLILSPFAKLPYLIAWLVWIGLTLAFFILMISKISGRPEALIVALAFPAVFWTIEHGQNAFLTAGLLAGGLHYLERKPILAGILFGLMSFKPHFGALLPFVFMVSGHWRVFFSAALTTIGFALCSWLMFGSEVWIAFLQSFSETSQTLNSGRVPFYKMQSLYASLRNTGLSIDPAYLLHGLFALGIFGFTLWIWHKPFDIRLKKATLCIGTVLFSPFMLSYDLTILAAAIVYLADYLIKTNFRPQLANLLFVVWISPFIVSTLSKYIPIPWTSILLSLLLYQILVICRLSYSKNEE